MVLPCPNAFSARFILRFVTKFSAISLECARPKVTVKPLTPGDSLEKRIFLDVFGHFQPGYELN